MMKRFLLAVSFSLFVALVLPLQTYLGNQSEYGFTLSPLLCNCLVLAGAMTAVLWAALWASDQWLRGWLTPLLVGLLVGFYLESGILAIDIPEIDGDIPAALRSAVRIAADLLILVSVLAASFLLFRRFGNNESYAAAAVLLLGMASICDVRREPAGTVAEAPAAGRAVAQDIVHALEFSPTRNVLLYVIDSAAATVASEITAADAALAAKFEGFTSYHDNIGMHGSTKHGVPGLMTGLYCGEGVNVNAYMNSVLSEASALKAYQRTDAAIFCQFDMLSCGVTTSTNAVAASASRADADARRPALVRPAKTFPYLSICDVIKFRIVPRAFKPAIVNHRLHTRRFMRAAGQSFLYDHNLYRALSERPVSSDPRLMFAKFHVHGAHIPLLFDAAGNPVQGIQTGYAAYRQAVSNAIVHLSRAMDDLRAKGVYDRSLIIVTTDHGSMENVDPAGRHPQASALLWVKPENATLPWRDSFAKTSHAGISAVLKAAADRSLTLSDIEPMLVSSNRLLRIHRAKLKVFESYHY